MRTQLSRKKIWETPPKPLDGYGKLSTAVFLGSFKALKVAWGMSKIEDAEKELTFLLGNTPWHRCLDIDKEFIYRTIERIREDVQCTNPSR